MWVYVIVVLFFVIFIYIGLYTEVGGTHEDKIVKWFKKQGYENIEVQYGTPQKQFMYNMHEIFIPADYYDVECDLDQ